MNLAGWRFVLFALVGTAAIVLLSSIGVPTREGDDVDRHSGERTQVVRNVAGAIAEARTSGNARVALETIRKRREQFRESPALLRLEAVLAAELAASFGSEADVPPNHPTAAGIQAERAVALRAREEFNTRARAREEIPLASAVALLTRLDADESIAAATEAFFEPLGRWDVGGQPSAQRPDELTARILAYLKTETANEQDADLFLATIRAHRTENRARARLRWALRAFGTLPGVRAIVDELIAAYLADGRGLEAFVVVGAALRESPDDVELWRMRARFAGWQSLPRAEIEARENLLRLNDAEADRERIVALYGEIGESGAAVAHAEELARGSTDPQVLLGPILLALDAGDTDRALAMLAERADASDDPVWWREKIIHYASQDMRGDRVIAELEWLRRHYPDGDYEARLEGLLRRRSRHEALADLLTERLQRTPDDHALEQELIQLRYSLGHEEQALALLRRRMERSDDPVAFFDALPIYRSLEIPGVLEHAGRLAASPRLDAEATPGVLLALDPLTTDADYLRIAVGIARRQPHLKESREFLVHMADRAPDDAARAAGVSKLAEEHPDDPAYLLAWAERAGWAGDLTSETTARERLVKLAPDDFANRRALADLYDAQNQAAKAVDQWRVIAAAEGIESSAQLRLVDVLLATEQLDEAMAILEKRANLPGATIEDQLHVGEDLFGKSHFDRALRFYDAVLDRDALHPVALLREGQIKAWTNDPRGAIPLLEQRLAVTDEDEASVRFTLGECQWAIGDADSARKTQQPALAAFLEQPDRTVEQDVMTAKMLSRFGRHAEARPLFERILADQPGEADLMLDYADSLMAAGDLARARPLVDRARVTRPQYARATRADGTLALQERRYEAAAQVLAEAIERFGPDAGTESELGRARAMAGEFQGSLAAYRAAHALQPANHDLDEDLRVMEDRLAKLLHVHAAIQRVAQDTSFNGWLAGSTLVSRGRTRVGALLGTAYYSGPAQAVDNGRTDVDTTLLRVDLAATHRFYRRDEIGVGVQTFAGANGNLPVALWAGVNFSGEQPRWNVALRGWWNELFSDPAAAAGLGGRSTGALVQGEVDIGTRCWVSGSARYENISLDYSDQNPSDPRIVGAATFGWRIVEGPTRVADPHSISEAHMPGVVGAMLGEGLGSRRPNMLSAWVNAATYQLLGDAELTQVIPLGKQFDYITLAARLDRQLGDAWGLMVEGYAGRELREKQSVYGIGAGLGWRPKDSFELALVGAYGSALGRSNSEASFHLRLGLTWRW